MADPTQCRASTCEPSAHPSGFRMEALRVPHRTGYSQLKWDAGTTSQSRLSAGAHTLECYAQWLNGIMQMNDAPKTERRPVCCNCPRCSTAKQ